LAYNQSQGRINELQEQYIQAVTTRDTFEIELTKIKEGIPTDPTGLESHPVVLRHIREIVDLKLQLNESTDKLESYKEMMNKVLLDKNGGRNIQSKKTKSLKRNLAQSIDSARREFLDDKAEFDESRNHDSETYSVNNQVI
jgi:hypothetical protein